MEQVFIKKKWEEEDILFYIHFSGQDAIRQIEVMPSKTVFLTSEEPVKGESMLYDQDLKDLSLDEKDFITQEEFETAWKVDVQ